MASVLNSLPSLSKEETLVLSEMLQKGVFEKPALSQIYGVRTGIKADKRLPILGTYSGLTGYVKTGCSTTAAGGSISVTDKTWTPKYISDRYTMCFDDIMGGFLQYIMANGLSKEDPSTMNAEFMNYVATMLQDNILEGIHLKAVFGDTALVAGTNNSVPSGSAKYFTPFNGWWKQGLAIVAGDATKHVAVDRNAETTYADQKFDATDTTNQVVTGILESAYNNADFRLRGLPKSDLVYICSASLVDQYKKERKLASGIDLAYTRVEQGFDTVQCGGIDVVEYNFLDRMIAAYFDTGTAWINPHRGILTTRANAANILIGTEEESNLSELMIDYDKYQKLWFADYGFMLDCKVGINERVMMIY